MTLDLDDRPSHVALHSLTFRKNQNGKFILVCDVSSEPEERETVCGHGGDAVIIADLSPVTLSPAGHGVAVLHLRPFEPYMRTRPQHGPLEDPHQTTMDLAHLRRGEDGVRRQGGHHRRRGDLRLTMA